VEFGEDLRRDDPQLRIGHRKLSTGACLRYPLPTAGWVAVDDSDRFNAERDVAGDLLAPFLGARRGKGCRCRWTGNRFAALML
jgi:hypothetical protein